MEHRMRDLDQIQESDADDQGRRLGTIILASVAFLGVSAAVGVVVGRAARPDVDSEQRDPLAELERGADLRAAPEAKLSAPDVEAAELTFPNALTEQEERPEVLAALAAAAAEEAALEDPSRPQAGEAPAALDLDVDPADAADKADAESPVERLPSALPASVTAGPAERALTEAVKHDPLVGASIPERPSRTGRAPRGEEGEFTLQVISYQDPGDARRFVEGLRAKGHKAFVMEADIPDRGRYYRVRIGPFKNRFKANRYRAKFEAAEQMNTYVVRRPRER